MQTRKKKMIAFRCPADLAEKIALLATADDRTLSNYLIHLLRNVTK